MRASFIALLLIAAFAVDWLGLDGRYSNLIWTEARNQGQLVQYQVQSWLRF